MNISLSRVAGFVFGFALACPLFQVSASSDETASATVPTPYLLQMIRDDAIHQELDFDAATIEQVNQAIAAVDPRWWVSRILPAETQAAEIGQLTELLRSRLHDILDDDQELRLEQLQRQAAGTRMLQLADVAQTLAITPAQSKQLQQRFAKTDSQVASLQKQLAEKKIESEEVARRSSAVQQEERQTLLDVLTDDQRRDIGGLLGEPFDFSKVKRTYPRAPEIQTEKAVWLDGDGVRMADLRGKVVVVFFYAFECINCQRNFTHYLAWHRDLADNGLVVIGIQTPETSAERDLAKVKAAKSSDGFEFPVLLDQASNNWRAWGTTMWPTTYIVDKNGFIRRWWQGELNWQGTLGEQQMRNTIEQLLTE